MAIAKLISLWMAVAWVALIVMMVVTTVYEARRPPIHLVSIWACLLYFIFGVRLKLSQFAVPLSISKLLSVRPRSPPFDLKLRTPRATRSRALC